MLRVTMTAAAIGLATLAVPAGTAFADGGYWDSPRSAYGHHGHVRSYHYVEKHYYHGRPRWRGRRVHNHHHYYGPPPRPRVRRHVHHHHYYAPRPRYRARYRCGGGPNTLVGTLLGGATGGYIGNQIGSGRGNRIATATGALLGLAVGNSIGRKYDCY